MFLLSPPNVAWWPNLQANVASHVMTKAVPKGIFSQEYIRCKGIIIRVYFGIKG
jgi:hypothetical protein